MEIQYADRLGAKSMRDLLGLCGVVAIIAAPIAASAQVAPAGAAQGVDVSSLQGQIDWSAVAASGISFGFARAANGGAIDTRFQQNYAGMSQAGLIRGAYQFFQPNQDATTQADLLLTEIGSLQPGDLAPVLDVETSGGQSAGVLLGEITTWANVIRTSTGRTPIIYTGRTFWNGSVGPTEPSADLWVASFGGAQPLLPNAWPAWTFWQYSATGSVAGINGVVDRDVFFGSPAELATFAGIPEPTTYGLLIAGFGLVGAYLRRSRRLRHSFA